MVLVEADDRYGGLLDDVGIELGPAERSGGSVRSERAGLRR